jgi:hypothetical protein
VKSNEPRENGVFAFWECLFAYGGKEKRKAFSVKRLVFTVYNLLFPNS